MRSKLMAHILGLVFLFSKTLCILCASSPKSKQSEIEQEWKFIRRAPSNWTIEVQVGLKQQGFGDLEQHLLEVSNPSHHRYGQYLNADEVNRIMAPSSLSISLVEEWLRRHGNFDIKYSPAKDWITLQTSIAVAERLLEAEFSEFQHEASRARAIRATTWSLPEDLKDHIELVEPTNSFYHLPMSSLGYPRHFPRSLYGTLDQKGASNFKISDLNQVADLFMDDTPALKSSDDLSNTDAISRSCNASAVTPGCVRALYGTRSYQAQAANNNAMALVNYDGEFNNRSDIQIFLKKYRPEAERAGIAYKFKKDIISGAPNPIIATPHIIERRVGREGNLDAQILLGIGFPTPLITYSVGGQVIAFKADKYTPTNTNEPFLTWLHHVLAQKTLPQIIVTSYGDIEQTVPYLYAKRVCEGFAQLGARGVTVIFGAGDSGVGKPGYCQSNNGSEAFEFLTSFPASCPYGTSVGATRNINPEIVAYNDRNGFVSGGGFSKYFPRPAYQNIHGVVDSYLDHLGPTKYEGLFNRKGRAYPDVAAQGYRRPIVWNEKQYLVDGTSASAPTFAAIIALVNDALIAKGKPALGFLNPWLYSKGYKAFTDITIGSNKGCNTTGFEALAGWDAASGFGTPWFPELLKMVLEDHEQDNKPWYWP